MPTFVHSKNARVLVNASELTSVLNKASFQGSTDVAETSVFGLDDKTYIPGLSSATQSFEGFVSAGTAEADDLITRSLGTAVSGTAQDIYTYWPNGYAAAQYGYAGRGLTTKYQVDDTLDAAAKLSFDCISSDGFDRVQSIRALAALTAAGTTTAVDNGTATFNGGGAYLHATTGTVTGGTIVLEHGTAVAGPWVALGTFATLAGTVAGTLLGGLGFGSFDVAAGGTVNQFLRVNITGWSGTALFAVAFARR